MKPRRQLQKLPCQRFPAQPLRQDWVAIEEPLQLTLRSGEQRMRLATILRTPGHDYELVMGYLFSLQLIEGAREIAEMSYCNSPQDYNRLEIRLRGPIPERALHLRSQEWVHGGCGACGQDQLEVAPPGKVQPANPASAQWLASLPERMRGRQKLFEASGGTHAATVGESRLVFEDVGRHNAVDKLIGHLLMEGSPDGSGQWLVLSGRAGFELVQKAVRFGFSGLVSVGPPTSLAVSYARQAGLCLVGFAHSSRLNCYHGAEFIVDLRDD